MKPRWILITFTTLFVQFLTFEVARAHEASQSGPHINGQDDRLESPSSSMTYLSRRLERRLLTRFESEVRCLALNLYFEARSEKEMGQRAVGHVVMNRVKHPTYPNSVCEVVRQGGEKKLHHCQFSWWCDGRSDKPMDKKAWTLSMRLARKIYLGIFEDTTDGALWYHATYVKPYWSKSLLQGSKIGQHVFYLENQQTRSTL